MTGSGLTSRGGGRGGPELWPGDRRGGASLRQGTRRGRFGVQALGPEWDLVGVRGLEGMQRVGLRGLREPGAGAQGLARNRTAVAVGIVGTEETAWGGGRRDE